MKLWVKILIALTIIGLIAYAVWYYRKKQALANVAPNLPVYNNPLNVTAEEYFDTNPANWKAGEIVWNISDNSVPLNFTYLKQSAYGNYESGKSATFPKSFASKQKVGTIAAIDSKWMRFLEPMQSSDGITGTYVYQQQFINSGGAFAVVKQKS